MRRPAASSSGRNALLHSLGMGSAVGALGEAGNGAKTPRIPVCFPEALPVPGHCGPPFP